MSLINFKIGRENSFGACSTKRLNLSYMSQYYHLRVNIIWTGVTLERATMSTRWTLAIVSECSSCDCLDTEFPFIESHPRRTDYANFWFNESIINYVKKFATKMLNVIDASSGRAWKQMLQTVLLAHPEEITNLRSTWERAICFIDLRLSLVKKSGSCNYQKPCVIAATFLSAGVLR